MLATQVYNLGIFLNSFMSLGCPDFSSGHPAFALITVPVPCGCLAWYSDTHLSFILLGLLYHCLCGAAFEVGSDSSTGSRGSSQTADWGQLQGAYNCPAITPALAISQFPGPIQNASYDL